MEGKAKGMLARLCPSRLQEHQGSQAHLSAPSLPSFPMVLLFEGESLEWPSLTEGDSCEEKEVFCYYMGFYTTASLAFTV